METKPWYQSWLIWLGVLQTLIGVTDLVRIYLEAGDFSPVALSVLVTGVLIVIRRVWYTDTEIQK